MAPRIRPEPSRRFVLPPKKSIGAPLPMAGQAFPRLDVEQVRKILPQLIDALSDAVLVVDRDRRVVAANRRFIEAFGAMRPDFVGTLCHQGIHCPEADLIESGQGCAACEVIDAKEARSLLRSVPDASGVPRRWETTLSPVLDSNGEVSHIVEVWRDITDRSQLESQLSHSERLASLGMLAAGVAHEINNPLASIVAGVESLKRWLTRNSGLGVESREEVAEIADVLERETGRSRETTEKLLLLAQPYQGAADWVDINQAARDTVTLLKYQTQKQGVTVTEDLDADLPRVWARGSGMRGVLMNLCMNAVQAMPDGGTLTVRTRRHGSRVEIQIEDSGPGIHPAHLDRIWDPFFTTKPVGKGTGLGLSITQRVVTRHGGTIRVESPVGLGARFIVEIPIEGSGGEHV